MTEIDVVLPEGVKEPRNKLATVSSSPESVSPKETAATEEETAALLDNKNHTKSDDDDEVTEKSVQDSNTNDKTAIKCLSSEEDVAGASPQPPTTCEEVDKTREEEDNNMAEDADDSQNTCSSENGIKEQVSPAEDGEATTNGDHDEDEVEKVSSVAENTCDEDGDGDDPLGAVNTPQDDEVNTEDEELSNAEKKSDQLDEEDEDQDQESQQSTDKSSEPELQTNDGAAAKEDGDGQEEVNAETEKKTTVNGFVASPQLVEENNENVSTEEEEKSPAENGEITKPQVVVPPSDAGVVNLDDDTDEDEDEDEEQAKPEAASTNVNSSAATVTTADVVTPVVSQVTGTASVSGAESSDDAVLIPSDSDSEMVEAPSPTNKQPSGVSIGVVKPVVNTVTPMDDDDDDDDCVVIEDDSPPSSSPNDLIKRKIIGNDLDDLQQNPSKRQRSSTPGGIGQLTIKDARSLMPHEAPVVSNPRDSVYPVTITNAVTGAATNLNAVGPPKLMPMSGNAAAAAMSQLNPPTLALSGMPSMVNNANLLPGLTDDMYVLEAPSFIVPYIYEKPPNDNIRDIIKAIERKYSLSPEDLAEADKSDEFDMITEQNKDDKPNEGEGGGDSNNKNKKKKRIDDESWSEQSDDDDDDDDDDDSESGMRTKVLIKEANYDLTALKGAIKPASAVAQSGGIPNAANKPGQENYFESPLGKFFMDIGVGLVQEYVQADLLRLQKRKMRKSLSRDTKDFERAINALSGNLQASKTKNAAFKFTMKRCEFCNFKSESALSMANHYETPHMNGVQYKCNFCTFEIRNATEIVYHMEAMHNIKARLIKPLPYHQCPNCGFEDNGKAKLARHQPVCAKKFRPELNLAPPNDWEAPAKIPRIKPRHGLVGTATAYQAMAAQAAAQKAALATIQQQQAQAQARNLQAAALAAQNAAKMRARTPQLPKAMPTGNTLVRNPAPVRNAVANPALALPNNYQLAAGQLVQQAAKKPVAGQPSISITPLPRQSAASSGAAASTSKLMQATGGIKPGQSPSGNNKAQFVICEICDGYIKDLEQLRNHMQWMHKVKIHPKMIYNRPPLNCQKCQFRFFTDQGLERHLLGSHGLVTSSMQEAANKGKDAGRCPVCGRMYQWKLLNHVSRDHHMTLKPAHLSYKCTVCTATFGMYKQFETHVYTAHSTVAKKAMDSKKNSAQATGSSMPSGGGGGGGGGGGISRSSLGATNDSLLKPLKINDEITIIPQPASKPRIVNMESHVID